MKRATFLLSLLCSLLSIVPSFVYAKTINLYDQPKNDAKVLQQIDLSTGIIPIFTPKEGGWMKVADPKNGNVGWIKSSDINNAGSSSSVTFTQQIINDGKTPNTYQVIQFGQQPKLTNAEVQAVVQKMQIQQQSVQENMQKAVQNMVKDINNLYDYHQQLNKNTTPIIMPILVVPMPKPVQTQGQPTTNKPASQATTNPTPNK